MHWADVLHDLPLALRVLQRLPVVPDVQYCVDKHSTVESIVGHSSDLHLPLRQMPCRHWIGRMQKVLTFCWAVHWLFCAQYCPVGHPAPDIVLLHVLSRG